MSAGELEAPEARLEALMLADRADLARLLATIRRRDRCGQPTDKLRAKAAAGLARAEARIARRRALAPRVEYPSELPIAAARAEILAALRAHSVVIVCGDTGSGKTTQLPKLCLEAGRGLLGGIAHTQPRRIAARAVAARLAEELGLALGKGVGLKVRFTEQAAPESLVKVMTDGILLNEIRSDRELLAYDTVIIDEAHERSLNIDFLLGYLKRLLTRRRDLKVIVTSATIDPERFATHFGGAPIVRVEGRSFPIDVRYRPRAADEELSGAICAAARELAATDLAELGGGTARDMLVFLPGERWIRDAARVLEREGPRDYEVLPLYARLTTGQQQRIFAPGEKPRIVLATNIAETSLTVPRIRFVIDSGLARISRYAARHRVQRLAVEPIAQANAQQRAGRCGRLAPGICVRLYEENDFGTRPIFTDPEIVRTELAGVILKLAALGVPEVGDFPFLDAPPTKAVNDAYRLLQVLGAMDNERRLTSEGEVMARLPLDPRLAKLLLYAQTRGVLSAALVLAAALSVVDPREYPAEQLEAARARHAETADARSDFVTYLNLWQAYRTARRQGEKAFRQWCKKNFLSLPRLREWDDVHAQLAEHVRGFGWSLATQSEDFKTLHLAVLAAFVDFVAERSDGKSYRGMHDARTSLFPGSPVAARGPRWVVAAEHVATERAYLRTVAQINPRWIPVVAPHLIKREHGDPCWDVKRGCVTARETASVFGLVLSAERRVDYGQIDAAHARAIFIRDALAADRLGIELPFMAHNRAARDAVLGWEARLRTRDLYIGERALARTYDAVLPPDVRDRPSLKSWCREARRARRLQVDADDLATRPLGSLPATEYPDHLALAGQTLALGYRYAPGEPDDGITLELPAVLLGAVPPETLDWLVPGWLESKVGALLRTLPKDLRRPLVPIPDTTAALLPALERRRGQQTLVAALRDLLLEQRRLTVPAEAFAPDALEPHLTLRIAVLDEHGELVAAGRDLKRLRLDHGRRGSDDLRPEPGLQDERWSRRGVTTWVHEALPQIVEVERYGKRLRLYPALVDERVRVDLTLLPPGPPAMAAHRHGTRRLFVKALPQQAALVRDRVLGDRELLLSYHGVGSGEQLADDVLLAAADECFTADAEIRDRAAFLSRLESGRATFVAAAESLVGTAGIVLAKHRAVRRRLAEHGAATDQAIRDDIEAQLDGLVYPHFLSATPAEWRRELGRYLEGASLRLDQATYRAGKDAEYRAMVAAAWTPYAQWRETRPEGWPEPPALTRYRFLVEEFRVSLFAQRLGTRVPISRKRLEAAWAEAAS